MKKRSLTLLMLAAIGLTGCETEMQASFKSHAMPSRDAIVDHVVTEETLASIRLALKTTHPDDILTVIIGQAKAHSAALCGSPELPTKGKPVTPYMVCQAEVLAVVSTLWKTAVECDTEMPSEADDLTFVKCMSAKKGAQAI